MPKNPRPMVAFTPQHAGSTALAGRLERVRFTSQLLADNALGDPAERQLYVYLPPGYDGGQERYPWVMLLAGYGSTNHSFLNYDFFEPSVVTRFDRLIQRGECAPALLVLPDAINRWGGSQFVDSAATGRYQSYLADELVGLVESRFRCFGRREGRAIAGRSSGGFGALRMGLDRPEVFGALASHAGDSAFEISILPELRAAAIAYDRAGGLAAFARRFEEREVGVSFAGLMILAYAAAYAPDPAGPYPHARMPFEPESAALVADVWQQFLAHDPLERMRRDETALRDAALVYLDAGNRDEHGLHFGARMMAELLRARGVAVEHEEFDGGHRGTAHRYQHSLPRLIDACLRALGATGRGER